MNTVPCSSSAGEGGVLGQEAVAGVDRLGAGALDHVEQLVDHQVALARRAGTEQVGLVGALDVQRVAVELGVDGDRGDPQLLAGTDDSDRDLAAVGDQDLREHAAAHFTGRGALGRREPGATAALTTIPAATVSLVASSIRMKLPVVRLRA